MRKMMLLFFLLCVGVIVPTFKNQAQNCPVEALKQHRYNSRDCSDASRTYPGPYGIHKWEKKEIYWANNASEYVFPEGSGQCAYTENCSRNYDVPEYWPIFDAPVVSSTEWSQQVTDLIAECESFLCPPGYMNIIASRCSSTEGLSRFYRSSGTCVSSGGGSGGGDEGSGDDPGDPPPDGGCQDCNCHYETEYRFVEDTEAGDSCYYKYRRTRYVCDGQVRWESSEEYVGWECFGGELY